MDFIDDALQILGDIGSNRDNLRLFWDHLEDVVPFVGAGLSCDFGFPRWSALLEDIADRAGLRVKIDSYLAESKFEEAARDLVAGLGVRFDDAIEAAFHSSKLVRPLRSGAVRLLPHIARGPVLTTNFDRVIEAAFEDAGKNFSDHCYGTWIRQRALLQRNKRVLLKLHGDYCNPDSRVLTLSEYEREYGNEDPDKVNFDRPLPTVLAHALASRVLLFLGCSLRSDRTTRVISRIAQQYDGTMHFAVLSASENTAARRDQFAAWNIRPLFYPDGRHDLVERLLASIAAAIDPPSYGAFATGWNGAPAVPYIPEEPEETAVARTLASYLRWVVRTHRELMLVGTRREATMSVPLEDVFVALRGDRSNPYELLQAQQLLADELTRLNSTFNDLPDVERRRLRANLLRKQPHMLSLSERDRAEQPGRLAAQTQIATISLADAFRNERWLAILGDPGSGKTTLGRWLALKFARTLLSAMRGELVIPSGRIPVTVPAPQVNPETPYDRTMIDLGPARLPILVRVSDFATERARVKLLGKSLTLLDWLCNATWNQQPPSDGNGIGQASLDHLFRHFLDHGNAVVILDGLDEITESADREDVVAAIADFCRNKIASADLENEPALAARQSYSGRPCDTGGNQIVVTSRIAGYHAAPLMVPGIHTVTIEPMRRLAVEHFCDTWMTAVYAVYREEWGRQTSSEAAALDASRALQAVIFDPTRPGLAEIATNPLLVSNIALLYLTLREQLPRTRAELYESMIRMLITDWRQSGLDADEVFYVLAPVAAEIHTTSPSGLIEETDLVRTVTRHLSRYRGYESDHPPASVSASARGFVQTLKDKVGLLGARAERLFGFVHLTFQEYLAGRWLIEDSRSAARNILSRLDDVRWREPIMLALGYAVWKWPSDERQLLLDELLGADDSIGDVLPRIALLLAERIAEFPQLPDAAYRGLVSRLLSVYSTRTVIRRFPLLRRRIENAFLALRVVAPQEPMDQVLGEAIANPSSPDLAPAAATIVRHHGWFTPVIVSALSNGLANDSAAWRWPIEEALRDLVSPEAREVEPQVTPVDEAVRNVLERLRKLETGEMMRETAGVLESMEADVTVKREELAVTQRLLEEESVNSSSSEYRALLRQKRSLEGWISKYEAAVAILPDLEAGGSATRDVLLQDLAEARAALEEQQMQNPLEYERKVRRYAIASVAKLQFDRRTALRVRSDLDVSNLEIRFALQQPLVAKLAVAWPANAIMVALYGGYPNHRADESDDDCARILRFLQRASAEREDRVDADLDEYVGRFGNKDTIGLMAAYVGGQARGSGAAVEVPNRFMSSAIYRTSALDGLVLELLSNRADGATWIRRLWEAWHEEPTARGKADAIAALVAMGEDVVPELERSLSNPSTTPHAEAALANLERLAEFLKDQVYRSRTIVLANLSALAEPDPTTWVDIADTALVEIARASESPTDFSGLMSAAPSEYQPVLRADAWYRSFCSLTDSTYDTAVMLDTAPDLDVFFALLSAAHRAPSIRAGRLPRHWDVELIPPKAIERADVPIEAVAAIDGLHLEDVSPQLRFGMWWVIVEKFAKLKDCDPDLRPLLAAIALQTGDLKRAFHFVPQLRQSRDVFGSLRDVARGVGNAYLRGRALAAVLQFFSGTQRAATFSDAVASASAIEEPFWRTRMFELLATVAGRDEREAVLDSARRAARMIADAEERARALLRLARSAPSNTAPACWIEAVASTATIPDDARKAGLYDIISYVLPDDPVVWNVWRASVAALPSEHLRARADRTTASLLLRCPPASLRAVISAQPDVWAPVLLAAACRSTVSKARGDRSLPRLWLRLAAVPSDDSIVDALIRHGADDGLTFTAEAAAAIDGMAREGRSDSLALLLPLLQSPQPDTVRIVEAWRHHSEPIVARHASLMVAEHSPLNYDTLQCLISMSRDSLDRSRSRAVLALRSRVWAFPKATPYRKTSELGIKMCDELASAYDRFSNVDVRIAHDCMCATLDVVQDDPVIIRAWLDRANSSTPDRAALYNLANIVNLVEETLPVFLAGFEDASEPTRLSLLVSVCQMSHIGVLVEGRSAEVVRALRGVDPDAFAGTDVLLNPELEVATVAVSMCANGAAKTAREADQLLRQRASSLADILRAPEDDELLSLLGSIGGGVYHHPSGLDPQSDAGARLIVENPAAFPILIAWLTETLERGEVDTFWFRKRKALLTVTAKVARLLPSAFARYAVASRMEHGLCRASRTDDIYARRAAIVLLGHLHPVGDQPIEALLHALEDTPLVQYAAFAVIERLTATPQMRHRLLQALESPSTVVAAGAARMLVSIARKERTPAEMRHEIMTALAETLRDRRSQRGIYRISGLGNDDEPVTLARLGTLDQHVCQALLEVSGIADAVTAFA